MVYKRMMNNNIVKHCCNYVKYSFMGDVIIVERYCTIIKDILISAYHIIVCDNNLLNVYILLINAK